MRGGDNKIPLRHQLRTRMIVGIVLPVFICLAILNFFILIKAMNVMGGEQARSVLWQDIVLFAVCTAVLLIAVILTAGFVVRQLRILTGYAGNLAAGNTDFKVATARRQDEFGILGRSVREIQLALIKIALLLDFAAKDALKGVLSIRVDCTKYAGTFGHIMDGTNKTNDSLCELIRGIRDSAAAVAEIARQLSIGAKNVANGSTEQASSIEEISVTVGDVLTRTKSNAENADKARELYVRVGSEAEKSSVKMKQLLASLDAINKSAAHISDVIRLIEDISFQTNILALNASVEAARAGVHGRGFSVVADEVKSLADKSAAAAKETGELLSDSIRRSKQSLLIGEDMEKTLAEIISGIGSSSGSIAEIAGDCEYQVQTIELLNTSLGQISQVVQSNSATAQESAASSEEMAAQSAMLMEMVSKYKIDVERVVAKPTGFNENDY